MLDAMPSSDLVSSSRKCRRLPKIMSRMISRLHLSPITSSVRLIAQPERGSSVIGGVPTWAVSKHAAKMPRKNRLQYCTSYPKLQPVAKHKWLRGRDGKTGHVEPDDARRFCRRSKPRHLLAFRCLGRGTGAVVDRPDERRRRADVRPHHL